MKRLLEKGGMGLVCFIMILLCAIFVPHFASTNNITALLMSISTIGMVACTMMLCLAAGDFDLSMGARWHSRVSSRLLSSTQQGTSF